MARAVMYEGVVTDAQTRSTNDGLFAGQKFWFSQAVPQRKWFIQNAEANGAIIVPLESQADVLLVDHTRKNLPPGSHSYKYVEQSIRNGELERLDDHIVGSASRADRPVGSVRTAAKGGRVGYTESEDQLLWDWVKPFMDVGGAWKGNEIYKQLERHNPRHTFQSWRDRWIKYTQYHNRQITSRIGPAAEYDQVYEELEVEGQPQTAPGAQPTNLETQSNSLIIKQSKHQSEQTTNIDSSSHKKSSTRDLEASHVELRTQSDDNEARPRANSSAIRTGISHAMGNEQSMSSAIDAPESSTSNLHHMSREQPNHTGKHKVPTDEQYLKLRSKYETKNEGVAEQEDNVRQEEILETEDGDDDSEQQDHDDDNGNGNNYGDDDVGEKALGGGNVGEWNILDDDPLPLYDGVTQTDARDLFKMTVTILNLPTEEMMRGFQGLAGAKTGLSARRWRQYFQKEIVPEYQARNNLEDDEKFAKLCERYVRRLDRWKVNRKSSTAATGNIETVPKVQPVSNDHDNLAHEAVKPAREETGSKSQQCSNCLTKDSHRWRKDLKGRLMCDPCGRFLRANGIMRPSSTWTEPPNDDDEHIGEDHDEYTTNIIKDAPGHQTIRENVVLADKMVQSDKQRQPESNESRKRSPGLDAHTESQSKTTSQSSASTGSVSDIPYRTEELRNNFGDKPIATVEPQALHSDSNIQLNNTQNLMQKRYQSGSDDQSVLSPKRRRLESNIPQSQRETSILSLSSTSSDDDYESSVSGQDVLIEQNNETRVELGKNSTNISTAGPSERLSLFLPELDDNEVDEQGFEDQEDEDQSSQSINQLPLVQLINEDLHEHYTEEHSSQYAPSEAPSEAVHFDNTPELSQAWRTGPQYQESDDDAEVDITDPESISDEDSIGAEEEIQASLATKNEQDDSSPMASPEQDIDEDVDFETAPQVIPSRIGPPLLESNNTLQRFDTAPETLHELSDQELSKPEEHLDDQERLVSRQFDTQALLNAAHLMNNEDTSFIIPPPEGGWDDEEDKDDAIQITAEYQKDPQTHTPFRVVKQEVPDSQTKPKQYINTDVMSDTSEPEDLETWLVDQERIYAHHNIEPKMLGSICSRALEATCLEVSLATNLVSSMVQRYIKGKYHVSLLSAPEIEGRSTPSSTARRKLKKKEKAKLLEALVPENEKGIWTTLDDQWLTGTDARKVQRVEEKHGEAWIKKRFEYLENLYKT